MTEARALLDAWRTNNAINVFLIDKIGRAGMRCSLSEHGGRDVGRQFAHLHNVRVWQLQQRAKALSTGLTTFPTKVTPTKSALKKALKASEGAVATFLTDVLEGAPRRRGFRSPVSPAIGAFRCTARGSSSWHSRVATERPDMRRVCARSA